MYMITILFVKPRIILVTYTYYIYIYLMSLPSHSIVELVKEAVLTDSLSSLRNCFQLPEDKLPTLTAVSPVSRMSSPSLVQQTISDFLNLLTLYM